MSELGDALAVVKEVLERHRVPYMVIGGVAVVVWGEPRTTRDVDVTVDVGTLGTGAFVDVAAETGSPRPEHPLEFAERTHVLPVRTPADVPVDFVLATRPFEIDAIRRARLVTVEGEEAPFCGPEDLVVHKIVSERLRDLEDVVGILRRQRDRLDLAGLDRTVAAMAQDLDEPDVLRRYESARVAAGIR
ncbi:MAG TPA: nucleotidyltransferase [Actinomycetota bacterium]|nr:nucleotidyltransferase [Actinomycetota bacterium]